MDVGDVSCVLSIKKKMMTANSAHEMLGHVGEVAASATAKALDWVISKEQMKPYESYTVTKAKQKSVPKVSDHVKLTRPGERMFLDLCLVKEDGKKILKYWRIMVDEAT